MQAMRAVPLEFFAEDFSLQKYVPWPPSILPLTSADFSTGSRTVCSAKFYLLNHAFLTCVQWVFTCICLQATDMAGPLWDRRR